MTSAEQFLARLEQLRAFQEAHEIPVADRERESPRKALHSLRTAASTAPRAYQEYLDEAVDCYENGTFRGAILMVWAAAVQRLYSSISDRPNGLRDFESANRARYGTSRAYREIKHVDDLLYLADKNFIQLGQDAGLYNKNAKGLLEERLILRNRCGHPTQYRVGREEAVVFIESLTLNIINGAMLNW